MSHTHTYVSTNVELKLNRLPFDSAPYRLKAACDFIHSNLYCVRVSKQSQFAFWFIVDQEQSYLFFI